MRAATHRPTTDPGTYRGGSVADMHRPDAPHRRSRRAAALFVACAVGFAGCSGESSPDVIDAEASPGAGIAPDGLTIAADLVWGYGRALRAVATADGALLVASSTGVYLVGSPDEPPQAIDQFDTSSQVGPIGVSPGGATFAVGLLSPPSVRTYDVGTGTVIAVHELPPEATVRTIDIDDAGRLLVDTAAGPYAAPDPATLPQPVLASPTPGQSAVLADGAIVSPVAGTADLAITRAGATTVQPLGLTDGATVLDVRSSPNRSALAVTVGVGPDAFQRLDSIVVLDASTLATRATIETGRALDPLAWTVTDEAVVTADGPALSFWTLDGQPITTAPPLDVSVSRLTPVPGGLLTSHADGTLVVWTAGAWTSVVLGESGTPIEHLALSADGTAATIVDRLGGITVRRTVDGSPTRSDDRFVTGERTGVSIDTTGTRVGVASSLGRVDVLDSSLVEQRAFTVAGSAALVGAVTFSPTSDTVAAGLAERVSESAYDDTVLAWNVDDGGELFRTGGEAEDIAGCSFFFGRVHFTPDGTQVAITSHDFSVQVLDVASGTVVQQLAGDTTVLDLTFSPDGTLLVATYDNGMVVVWNTADYSVAASYRGAQGGYFAIAVLPSGASMAAADITGAITLLDLKTGQPVQSFADATNRTSTLALSADGRLLAAPTADFGVAVWSTASGALLGTAAGHTGAVTGIAFSPTGDWFASSSADGTVRTWSLTVDG